MEWINYDSCISFYTTMTLNVSLLFLVLKQNTDIRQEKMTSKSEKTGYFISLWYNQSVMQNASHSKKEDVNEIY